MHQKHLKIGGLVGSVIEECDASLVTASCQCRVSLGEGTTIQGSNCQMVSVTGQIRPLQRVPASLSARCPSHPRLCQHHLARPHLSVHTRGPDPGHASPHLPLPPKVHSRAHAPGSPPSVPATPRHQHKLGTPALYFQNTLRPPPPPPALFF